MRKTLFTTLLLICFSISQAQTKPKLEVKIVPSQTQVSLYTNVHFKAWLYNNGTRPISIFRQDYTAPAWLGVIENWYCTFNQKKDTFPKLMTDPSSGYNENNIIEVVPGDSMMVDTLGYTFCDPGNYTFTYNIVSSRRKVIIYYAMTALAKAKVASLTEFNITSLPLTIICKPVLFSPEKMVDLPLDEIMKSKKHMNSLQAAFKNPEDVFIFSVEGHLNQRDLTAIGQLKNIHSLKLSNVYLNDNEKVNPSYLDFSNLKELIIENSELEITDNLLTRFPKLEKISFKNVIYHNPSKALNSLLLIKSITMTNCQINSLSADFSKLQNLVRLELTKNNLKEIPAIINHPKLEYIDIQENNLITFPDVLNNPSLKSICLAKNKITMIPEDIGKLKALVHLDLSANTISVVPPQMGKLKALTALILTENQISHLPDEFKNLSNLQILILGDNKYSTVEPVIFKISSLKKLVLSKNDLAILPEKIGKLIQLSDLDVAENKISQLPESMLQLKQLSVLKVKGNPIIENKISKTLRTKLKSGYYN